MCRNLCERVSDSSQSYDLLGPESFENARMLLLNLDVSLVQEDIQFERRIS